MGAIFAENLSIFENSGFDFGNGYFDNDYGQTSFLDGILMDIMVDFRFQVLLVHFQM